MFASYNYTIFYQTKHDFVQVLHTIACLWQLLYNTNTLSHNVKDDQQI